MFALVRNHVFSPYNTALHSRPLLTKSLTGLVLAGTGDLVAQNFEKRNGATKSLISSNRDPFRRFLVFASFGMLWTGPFNHYWLRYLARRFPADAGRKVFVQKLAVDDLIWNPVVYFPVFFSFNGYFLGLSREEFVSWVKRDYVSNLIWCYIVWGPTTAVMFSKIPEHLQSVFMAGLSLGWNSFLSWKSNR